MFASAPPMLGALEPCWAMIPLVGSQLLPLERCSDVEREGPRVVAEITAAIADAR